MLNTPHAITEKCARWEQAGKLSRKISPNRKALRFGASVEQFGSFAAQAHATRVPRANAVRRTESLHYSRGRHRTTPRTPRHGTRLAQRLPCRGRGGRTIASAGVSSGRIDGWNQRASHAPPGD